jgi:hypothetical protein
MMRRILLTAVPALVIISCNTKKDKQAEKENAFYFDYRIVAEEGNDNLVATAQFRDEDGDALPLDQQASITLDGQPLLADSSKYTGYTYETYRAIDSFAGEHRFTYTNEDGQKSEAAFNFTLPRLADTLSDKLRREDLELKFTGLDDKTSVRIVLTDTSFINEGLNTEETVRNGRLLIPASAFKNVSNGPVQLELTAESRKRLGDGRQGRVLLVFTWRKEFLLGD